MGADGIEAPPSVVARQVHSLSRQKLEELAQQLFCALRRSDGALMELRRVNSRARTGPATTDTLLREGPRGRSAADDASQQVFERLYNSAREHRVRRLVPHELGMGE